MLAYQLQVVAECFNYIWTAGLPAGDKGSCVANHGASLVSRAKGVDTGYALVGVMSRPGCGSSYDVYTEVSHYLPWIAHQFGLTFPSRTDTLGQPSFKMKNKKLKKEEKTNRKGHWSTKIISKSNFLPSRSPISKILIKKVPIILLYK